MEKPTINTQVDGFHLRTADAEDTELVLRFIRELAAYEKLAHAVTATAKSLREALFGERPGAEVVLGEYQGEAVAFALFFHNFSTFLGQRGIYLEDLFVLESMRGRGFGRCLLAYLAKLAVDRHCGRLEWSVLDWNTPAIDFYRALGAQPMADWTTFRASGKSLRLLAGQFSESA